jgi:nitroimidazol reductase NimA-like FMN-containing flavoprotein (pyridoxamine 5'-phosphate oxidase superfamily)
MATTEEFVVSPENRVSRTAERGAYDKATIFSILDSAFICNIGFVHNGKPIVIPMTYWREGEYVYFHSGTKGRFATACSNSDICLTVTHFDGLVLGHSAFNHSFNYRSVVVHGRAEVIQDHDTKAELMKSFVEHVMPGRYQDIRPVKDNEVRALTLMRLKLQEVSAKIRDEFPDEETVSPDWPAWIGVVPAKIVFAPPVSDPSRNKVGAPPAYIDQYQGSDRYTPRYFSEAFAPLNRQKNR